jgi:uncharacterized protein YraI/predicted small lipoprotein YifL
MKRALKTVVVLLTSVALAGCGALPISLPGQSQTPASIKINSPVTNTTAKLGDAVAVQGESAGTVASVLLMVNGNEYAAASAEGTAVNFEWSPLDAGQNVIQLVALDGERKSIAQSELVYIKVEAAQPTAAPAPTEAPLPTAAPEAQAIVAPTAAAVVPTVAAPATAQAVAPASPALTITNEFANLRAGPDTTYDLAGRLNQGQTATVLGKSADGKWWQIQIDGKTVWVFGELVQANGAANGVAVAQAPARPTAAPATAAPPALPTATPQLVALAPTAVPPAIEPTPVPVANPAEPPCNPENPFWAPTINPGTPYYTFCTPVPFEFVDSGNPDEVRVRWHIYGDFVDLELRMDPSGDSCGMGSTGFRQKVGGKEDNFRINKKQLPAGGYKLGIFVTFADGRLQDWGELHFCGG